MSRGALRRYNLVDNLGQKSLRIVACNFFRVFGAQLINETVLHSLSVNQLSEKIEVVTARFGYDTLKVLAEDAQQEPLGHLSLFHVEVFGERK